MTLPKIKVALCHGDDNHPTDMAFVKCEVSREAFYGGLNYEQIAQLFEQVAKQMRAYADANPRMSTKTLEQVCASITK